MGNQIRLNPVKKGLKSGLIYLLQVFSMTKRRTNQTISPNPGFTLPEVIIVIVIIGILSAIAIPSWLTFINRQRLNKATNAVVSAIQDAQQKAKNTKQTYMVSFQTTAANVIQAAVYPAIAVPSSGSSSGVIPANYWQELDGGNLQIPPGSIILGSNITGVNTTDSVIYSKAYSSTKQNQTIQFSSLGTLPIDATTTSNYEIVLAIPINNSTTTPTPSSTKRCVLITTLLGTTAIAKDANCP
jgi:prepilin-type N-terminal cleavage/methylation domain-containing protein